MTYIPYNHDKKGNHKKQNTKQKQKTQQKQENNISYVPNNLFKIFVTGMCLYLCVSLGYTAITDTYSKIKNAKGKIDQAQELLDYANAPKKNSKGGYEYDVTKNFSIDEEDVKDILLKLDEFINDGEAISEDVVVIKYSKVNKPRKFKKRILNKLHKYKGSVTYVILSEEDWTTEDTEAEMHKMLDTIQENITAVNEDGFTNFHINGRLNYPRSDSNIIIITFLDE